MRTLYIDCSSGMSGDMMLGAFVDMGMPISYVEEQLGRLGIKNEFSLSLRKKEYQGKQGADVDVKLKDSAVMNIHPYSVKARNYADIQDMMQESGLSSRIQSLSNKIFAVKAKAEATVHNVPPERVQFHEIGAIDSIVDVVGAAIGLDYFDIGEIVSTEVPTGYGTVRCACGELPVPAPAVKQILSDTKLPHYRSDVKQELLTPTGAAILAGVVDKFGLPEKCSNVLMQGVGFGKRKTGLPPLKLTLCGDEK